jgi:hypothetical protein
MPIYDRMNLLLKKIKKLNIYEEGSVYIDEDLNNINLIFNL